MKGWVYVITNEAMPGLVKVGFSTKDPELRAGELNHTGSPHPYIVEYEILIEEPYQIEQKTHKLLLSKYEKKEWFRCSPEEAVTAIRQVAGNGIIMETYKRLDRIKAEEFNQRQREKQQAEFQRNQELRQGELLKKQEEAKILAQKAEEEVKRKQLEQELEKRFVVEELAIKKEYEAKLSPPSSLFYSLWGVGIGVVFGLLLFVAVGGSGGGSFLLIILFIFGGAGASIGGFVVNDLGLFEGHRRKSSEYIALEQEQQKKLEAVRKISVLCEKCGKRILYNKSQILLAKPDSVWKCPSCQVVVQPLRHSPITDAIKSSQSDIVAYNIYRVIVGQFTNKSDADLLLGKFSKYKTAFVKKTEGKEEYSIQITASDNWQFAKNIEAELKNLGYTVFIVEGKPLISK